jgi:hypothetical protein
MNYDVGEMFNDSVNKILSTSLMTAITNSLIYSSLVIIGFILLTFIFITAGYGLTYKVYVRFGVYVFLIVMFGFHLHYKAIEKFQIKEKEKNKDNEILSQIQKCQEFTQNKDIKQFNYLYGSQPQPQQPPSFQPVSANVIASNKISQPISANTILPQQISSQPMGANMMTSGQQPQQITSQPVNANIILPQQISYQPMNANIMSSNQILPQQISSFQNSGDLKYHPILLDTNPVTNITNPTMYNEFLFNDINLPMLSEQN